MKYCPNCGNQINDNETICSKCGTKVEEKNASSDQQPAKNFGGPKIQQRSLATCIILSLVTCGLYGIIWWINMINDVNTITQDEHSNQSGGTVFLLTLITCGIYGFIWMYQVGKRMETAGKKYGLTIVDNSILYLVLQLFGLGIVDYCLIQTDLNKFAE